MFSEATLARFAREVAKYPSDQKQSAVMACLAIVQHEQGHVSAEAENAIAAYLGRRSTFDDAVARFAQAYVDALQPVFLIVGVLITIFAAEYKTEPEFVSTAVVLSTALSPIVVTLWVLATRLY